MSLCNNVVVYNSYLSEKTYREKGGKMSERINTLLYNPNFNIMISYFPVLVDVSN